MQRARHWEWKSRLLRIVWGERLGDETCPYMRRWYVELFGFTLRLHHFFRSDLDRHLHDHPWWFITFPLGAYHEWVPLSSMSRKRALRHDGPLMVGDSFDTFAKIRVAGWRPHFRRANHRHRVVIDRPQWTVVLSGRRSRDWGFWVEGKHMLSRLYFGTFGHPPCED